MNGATHIGTSKVRTITLEDIYRSHPMAHPHFLSIDVEGLEMSVLQGNDFSYFKPDLICVEEHKSPIYTSEICTFLKINGYELLRYNGVSAIYVLDSVRF